MGSLPDADVRGVFADYEQHSSAQKITTEVVLTASLRACYPGMIVSIVDSSCDLFGYAAAGYAGYTPNPEHGDYIQKQSYHGPRGRLSTKEGSIQRDDVLSKYEYLWEGNTFLLYRAQVYRPYSLTMPTSCFILKQAEDGESIYGTSAITEKLITACSKWSAESHEEIWVFDKGYWAKSKELYQAVHDAKWEDVILDEVVKKSLVKDVEGFFDAQETYKRFGIPWKVGLSSSVVHHYVGTHRKQTADIPIAWNYFPRPSWEWKDDQHQSCDAISCNTSRPCAKFLRQVFLQLQGTGILNRRYIQEGARSITLLPRLGRS